jgi:PIN domain nuclease of toxin-antitoxin system
VKYLLDTHALIWFLEGDKKFSKAAAAAFIEGHNDFFVSVASIWEIAIKISLGKLRLRLRVEDELRDFLREQGFLQMDIEFAHVASIASLPFKHKDPFDRLLIAQALKEGMILISHDSIMDEYGVNRLW